MEVHDAPGGGYAVQAEPRELGNTLWVYTPEIIDRHAGTTLFSFVDKFWSLDRAIWRDASVVHLMLRKFPGRHVPATVEVLVDCARRRATIGSAFPCDLDQLEQQLEAVLALRPQG